MIRKEKSEIVKSLTDKFVTHSHFYIIDATGLDGAKVSDFRRRCFQAGVLYQVSKNTFISKALVGRITSSDHTSFCNEVLKGSSGILFVNDESNAPAKLIRAFQRKHEIDIPIFKGAFVENSLFIGEQHLEVLSKLKSKKELIGDVIMLLHSPLANLISTLQHSGGKLAGLVKALSEKKSDT